MGNMQWVLKVLAELSKLVYAAVLELLRGSLLALGCPQVNLGQRPGVSCVVAGPSPGRYGDLAQLTLGYIGR